MLERQDRENRQLVQQIERRFGADSPLAAAGRRIADELHREIDQHVRRAGIEREHLRPDSATPVDRRDVADAAQIIHAHVPAAFSEHADMKRRGQGSALSACREVRRAEVAHDGHAQPLSQINVASRGIRG